VNKDQLIDKVVDKTGFSKNEVKQFLEAVLDIIIETLKRGKKINIVGFGSFRVAKRKGRKGVNPQTGKEIKIPDVKIAKFKPGTRLKKAIK